MQKKICFQLHYMDVLVRSGEVWYESDEHVYKHFSFPVIDQYKSFLWSDSTIQHKCIIHYFLCSQTVWKELEFQQNVICKDHLFIIIKRWKCIVLPCNIIC